MIEQPRVVMCSMWRNDGKRNLSERAEHLIQKQRAWPNLRWCWVVGDSTDETEAVLSNVALGYDVNLVVLDTGIKGDDEANRLRRLSLTANAWFERIRYDDDFVLVHESDLVSGPDVVMKMMANVEAGRCPVAAWPTLQIFGHKQFYDVWAFRKDGEYFSHDLSKHPAEPFTVDSFGSVYLFNADDARHIRMETRAVLDFCDGLRERGRTLWADPQIEVQQPQALWTPQEFAR